MASTCWIGGKGVRDRMGKGRGDKKGKLVIQRKARHTGRGRRHEQIETVAHAHSYLPPLSSVSHCLQVAPFSYLRYFCAVFCSCFLYLFCIFDLLLSVFVVTICFSFFLIFHVVEFCLLFSSIWLTFLIASTEVGGWRRWRGLVYISWIWPFLYERTRGRGYFSWYLGIILR